MEDCEVKDSQAEVRGDCLKNTPIIQLYSPEFYHEEQAIVMNEVGRTALISALQSGQHVLPAFCSDGEGYYLILITGKSTEEIDIFKKPYTGDICRDCDRFFYINKSDKSSFDFGFGCPYGCDDNGRHVRTMQIEVKELIEIEQGTDSEAMED